MQLLQYKRGHHSPDNVKFPDGSRHSFTAFRKLSVTTSVTVSGGGRNDT